MEVGLLINSEPGLTGDGKETSTVVLEISESSLAVDATELSLILPFLEVS